MLPPIGPALGAASDSDNDSEAAPTPAPASAGVLPAAMPSVDDEVMALATRADRDLGPRLVTAIAAARGQHPLRRVYLKNLEVHSPVVGDAHRTALMRFYLGESTHGEFTALAGTLLRELSREDELLDVDSGEVDAGYLLSVVRELFELCAEPPRLVEVPQAADAAQLAAAAAAAAAGAVAKLHDKPDGDDPKEPTFKKMSIRKLRDRLAVFEQRPGREVSITDKDVANRTLLNALEESLVVHGVFPVDRGLMVDRMSPLRDPVSGVCNITDEVRNEFNPSTGKIEDVNRDLPAKDARDTSEYLRKLRILAVSIAFVLHGRKCDAEPHAVAGEEGKPFLRLSAVMDFLKQAAVLEKKPLANVRSIIGYTLDELAEDANRAPRQRLSVVFRRATEQLKRRCEPVAVAARADLSPELPPAEQPPPPPDLPAAQELDSVVADAVAAALAAAGKGVGRRRQETPEEKKARAERAAKRNRKVAEVTVDGTVWKARKGGNDDAPKCTDRRCNKLSYCPYSHKEM